MHLAMKNIFFSTIPASLRSIKNSIGQIQPNRIALGTLGMHTGLFIVAFAKQIQTSDPSVESSMPMFITIGLLLDHICHYLEQLAQKSLLQQILQMDSTANALLLFDIRLIELIEDMNLTISYEEHSMALALKQDSKDFSRLVLSLGSSAQISTNFLETLHDIEIFTESRMSELPATEKAKMEKILSNVSKLLAKKIHRLVSSTKTWSIQSSGVHILTNDHLKTTQLGDLYHGVWNGARVVVEVITGVVNSHIAKLIEIDADMWFPLEHPHISKLMGVCLNVEHPFIVTRPIMCTLSHHLKHSLPLDALACNNIVVSVAMGLYYLHTLSEPVIHGNLDTENIYLDLDGIVCISGFGMLQTIKELYKENSDCRDLNRVSPKYLTKDYQPSLPMDIYAFASVCMEVYSSQSCSPNSSNHSIKHLPSGEPLLPVQSKHVPDLLWETLKACWNLEPSKRPSIKTIMLITRQLPNSLNNISPLATSSFPSPAMHFDCINPRDPLMSSILKLNLCT
ncbi:hypothetical protein BDV3_003051 [Batrachochytrium dendrobatidis]